VVGDEGLEPPTLSV